MSSKRTLAVLAAITGFTVAGQCHLIHKGYFEWSNLGNAEDEADKIESVLNLVPDTLVYLNKFEYPGETTPAGFEDGGAVDYDADIPNYSVNPWTDTKVATIGWNLTDSGYYASYVLVKDGKNQTSGSFYYSLYEVSSEVGSDQRWVSAADIVDIQVDQAGDREISHITWFGGEGSSPPDEVPDGGATAALLGLGVLGLGFISRRKV